jgi:hypothetical protein
MASNAFDVARVVEAITSGHDSLQQNAFNKLFLHLSQLQAAKRR